MFTIVACVVFSAFYVVYGKGSTFPLKRFLNDGVPGPKLVGMPS